MSDNGGAVAGGAVAYSSATLAYKAFNGLLPKAQLFVPKMFSLDEADDLASSITKDNDVMALKALVKKKKINAKKAVASSGVLGSLKQAMGVMPVIGALTNSVIQGSTVTMAMSQKNYSVMEVQYNPKSISLTANNGPMLRRPPAGDACAQQMGMTSKVSRITFTVELVFEDIVAADAFHLEGLSMNAEELSRTLMNKVTDTFLGGHSVKKQCDGLVSLLNYKKLKQVVFLWGDMFFHGELTSVDVRYELFNKNGNPILAKVRLTLEQNDSEKTIRYSSDEMQWSDAIDIAFGSGLL